MKTLTVTIKAEIEIPDDWELVDHSNGMRVLKHGDKFIDFDIVPLTTTKDEAEAQWTDEDIALTDKILDAIIDFDTELAIQMRH